MYNSTVEYLGICDA